MQPWKALYNTAIQSPDVQGEGQASIAHCSGDLQIPGFWAIHAPTEANTCQPPSELLIVPASEIYVDISTLVLHFLNGIRKRRRFRDGSGEGAGAMPHSMLSEGHLPPASLLPKTELLLCSEGL